MKDKSGIQWAEIGILLLVLSVVFSLWLGAWYLIDDNIISSDLTITNEALRGQFGDKFGAINALFSGFAFAGIIFTIFLQRKDLKETHSAMSHERFDNTFFQLLNVHIAIAEKVTIGGGGHVGRFAFERFNETLKFSDSDFPVFSALQKIDRSEVRQIIDTRVVDKQRYPGLDDFDVANLSVSLQKGVGAFNNYLDSSIAMHERKIIDACVEASKQHIDHFSHYFRNLYHIFKFIDESKLISESEKVRYSRFVRSQLSQVELVTLFYNSIGEIALPGREDMELGCPKMGRLLVRFDVLQNMNPRNIFHPLHADIFKKNNSCGGCDAK